MRETTTYGEIADVRYFFQKYLQDVIDKLVNVRLTNDLKKSLKVKGVSASHINHKNCFTKNAISLNVRMLIFINMNQ